MIRSGVEVPTMASYRSLLFSLDSVMSLLMSSQARMYPVPAVAPEGMVRVGLVMVLLSPLFSCLFTLRLPSRVQPEALDTVQ